MYIIIASSVFPFIFPFEFNNLKIPSSLIQARRLRKTLGGGMRQVGILCAAALVALHENVGKLESDHKKAKILAGMTSHSILHILTLSL